MRIRVDDSLLRLGRRLALSARGRGSGSGSIGLRPSALRSAAFGVHRRSERRFGGVVGVGGGGAAMTAERLAVVPVRAAGRESSVELNSTFCGSHGRAAEERTRLAGPRQAEARDGSDTDGPFGPSVRLLGCCARIAVTLSDRCH